MMTRIYGELGKFALALIAVTALLFAWLFVTSPRVDILDYGQSFSFYNSARNRLFIEITGRTKVDDNEYVALANHPREDTFNERYDAYSRNLAEAGGASTITFLMGSQGNAILERRYQAPQPENVQHECRSNPYGVAPHYEAERVSPLWLSELETSDDILQAAGRGRKIYGVMTYTLDGHTVTSDFPGALVNINPKGPGARPGERWQLVTGRMPLYIGGDPNCEGVREGHAAIRTFNGLVDVVYLCRKGETNDMTCSRRIPAKVRLFTTHL